MKKSKEKERRIKSIPVPESYQEINHLYQCAYLYLQSNPQLSRQYIRILRDIVKKHVIRLSPEVKRTMCKKCNSLLIDGISSTVRINGTPDHHIVVTCNYCASYRRWGYNSLPSSPSGGDIPPSSSFKEDTSVTI